MVKLKLLILLGFSMFLGSCAGMQSKPIPPDEVIEMARSGMPSDVIIQKLKDSGTVYRLSAGEVVKLHQQGVPTPVLDYMQDTYLNAVRQEEAQRAFLYQPSPFFHDRYYHGW